MKAMIFSAGFGSRMKSLTENTPKTLLPYKGRAIISHIISLLPEIDELAVNTHFLANQIEAYFQSQTFPFKINLFYEPAILGTGGGLQNTALVLSEHDFLLWNGDIICDADFKRLISTMLKSYTDTDVILFCNQRIESSYLLFDEANLLRGVQKHDSPEKQNNLENTQKMAFCGISYFTQSGSRFFFENDYRHASIVASWLEMAKQGKKIRLCDISNAKWTDLGTIQKYNNHITSEK